MASLDVSANVQSRSAESKSSLENSPWKRPKCCPPLGAPTFGPKTRRYRPASMSAADSPQMKALRSSDFGRVRILSPSSSKAATSLIDSLTSWFPRRIAVKAIVNRWSLRRCNARANSFEFGFRSVRGRPSPISGSIKSRRGTSELVPNLCVNRSRYWSRYAGPSGMGRGVTTGLLSVRHRFGLDGTRLS